MIDIGLSEEQEILRRSAREFLGRECPKNVVRDCESNDLGYVPELWSTMAALGWLGICYPEEYGGMGGTYVDMAVLCEEMGRALLPSPFQPTVIQSGLLILEAGSEDQKHRYLPSISRGDRIMTLAFTEPSASHEPQAVQVQAVPQGDHFRIDGTKLFVPDAHIAQDIICVARTASDDGHGYGLSLFVVDARTPGISRLPLKTIAGDKQFEVTFEGAAVPAENLMGQLHRGWQLLRKVLQIATVMKCAEMVGGARSAFEMSMDYARQRVAFGRPIGSFQAIQHKLVEMVTNVDTAWLATYEAAWKLSAGLLADIAVSMAKAHASDAYAEVTFQGQEIHAGVAFFYEHDLQLYYRRARAAQVLFGDARYHRRLMAQALGL